MGKKAALIGNGCLTAKQVEHAKPKEKRYEIPSGPPAGLYLVVHVTGKKSWIFRYRFGGRTRGMTFNDGLTLAAARAEAEAARETLKDGKDPAAVQAIEEQQAEPNSAKAVAEEWLKRAVKQTATHDEVSRILHKEVLPAWKHRLITDIGRPDVLRVLDGIVDRGAPVLANRTLSILKRFFRWTLERGYIDVSPVAGIRPPAKEETRDRVLTEDELREIWNAAPDLGFPFGDYFRLLILTGQRRAEAATTKWADVDIGAELWTLPRASTKARRIHDVPLAPAAKALLAGLPRFKGDYVFTTTSGARPVSGFSKAKTALDRAIVERQRETDPKAKGLDEWHIHDLRRTMATWMADHDVAPHVLAAILNHSPGSTLGITAIYARSKWAKAKREALEAWAEFVVSLEAKKAKATA